MLSDALATIGLRRPGKQSIKERRERIGADLLSSIGSFFVLFALDFSSA
jgi:hypothetical protein